ncbi:hypothetical protein [Marinactinospora rubrisoli]|uniref:Uncharacterized protein n=1 Tax=Marinactinospora rubrisoli TaxID=2715399 RepID=A0ABW2KDI9_9ACTN
MSYFLSTLLGMVSGLFSTLVLLFAGGFALIWAGRAPAGRGLVRSAGALLLVDALVNLGRTILFALANYPGRHQEASVDLVILLAPFLNVASNAALIGAVILLLVAVVRGSRRAPAGRPAPGIAPQPPGPQPPGPWTR